MTSDHGGGPSVRLFPFAAVSEGRRAELPVELSVIVPVLNEAIQLQGLFKTLAAQRQAEFELIVCDGGSDDGSVDLLSRLQEEAPFQVRVLVTAAGRGRQLNAGAAVARGAMLLLLHADSFFPDPLAFNRSLSALREAAATIEDRRVAGHFALRFDEGGGGDSAGYYYFETKARLGRRGTIHGDQGFLLSADFFKELGSFEERGRILEDTRFADSLLEKGTWHLLPAEIITSARRFRTEGLQERQILNALVMNFSAIGWDAFLLQAPDLYRNQDRTRPLDLLPFLLLIENLLDQLPWNQRWQIFFRTGAYVRSQNWQLGLALDCRRLFRQGVAPGAGPYLWLRRFDRWFDPLTDHSPGYLLTGMMVRGWFILLRRRLKRRCRRADGG